MLVVGVGSLLTSLARCCRPAPPDAIAGYVTRGKGVAVHRAGCSNLRELVRALARARHRGRLGRGRRGRARRSIRSTSASRRATGQGLLRDVSEVLAKEKINVIGVRSQSVRDGGGTAFMTFTVEVADANRLAGALGLVRRVSGVRSARRR